jgi:hypothetical protein
MNNNFAGRVQLVSSSAQLAANFVTVYKTKLDKLTTRKPKGDYNVEFVLKFPLPTVKKDYTILNSVVTSKKELNLLKNDVGFLVEEMFPEGNFTLKQHYPGTILYCWVCLQNTIFPFDLMYITKSLLPKEIKFIINTIKKTKNLIYARNLYEKPSLNIFPFTFEKIITMG